MDPAARIRRTSCAILFHRVSSASAMGDSLILCQSLMYSHQDGIDVRRDVAVDGAQLRVQVAMRGMWGEEVLGVDHLPARGVEVRIDSAGHRDADGRPQSRG